MHLCSQRNYITTAEVNKFITRQLLISIASSLFLFVCFSCFVVVVVFVLWYQN